MNVLEEAIVRLVRVEQRLSPLPNALGEATRQVDRLMIAATIDGARMELSYVRELLRDALPTIPTLEK